MKVYSVYDAKAEIFGNPFVERTDASARRAFAAAVNDPQTAVSIAPQDYSIFRLGKFDDENGVITPEKAPVQVALGLELVQTEANDVE